MYSLEHQLAEKGYRAVCGVDEAGCGPLAGPVYAAAVILNPIDPIEGINDSKKLSEKKRETAFDAICQRALAWSVASVEAEVIDEINILQARLLAMRKAVKGLAIAADYVLVDGNRDPLLDTESLLIIKGDQNSASIAAASILAKVSRDRYMLELSALYPEYRFEKHKGYPTQLHYQLLEKHGPSPVHRRSFLKKHHGQTNEVLP